MSSETPRDELAAPLQTSQILSGALLAGPSFFLAIATFVMRAKDPAGLLGKQPFALSSIFVLVGLALGAGGFVLSRILPTLLMANQRRRITEGTWSPPASEGAPQPLPQTDEGRLAVSYVTARVLELAPLEGGAFFNVIAFMLEGSAIALILAVGLLAVMAAGFPTRGRLIAWIEDQRERLRLGS